MKAKEKTEIAVNSLPTYLDGGGGSMWQSRDVWAEILSAPAEDVSVRRYIRASDLIALLESHNIKLVLVPADTIIES